MVLPPAPKYIALAAFILYSASFPVPPHAVLKIEAPWPYDSMLTPAKTKITVFLAKVGVIIGAIVAAASASRQQFNNAFCQIIKSWATLFQLPVQCKQGKVLLLRKVK
jgi:hypothetical protein